jgi:hypothetical protein
MADVFVFGSNIAGRHGAGSALEARRKFGAIYGKGTGRQGDSYAIPTKDANLRVLPLKTISMHVAEFKLYAQLHLEDTFWVVKIGCGLAGYAPSEIGPMFKGSGPNVRLPEAFEKYR